MFTEYKKAAQEKQVIDIFAKENKLILNEVIREITAKGIVTQSYYKAILDFSLFWYFFTTLFITSFALLYYRKFKSS